MFSNWLMMYLDDSECHKLILKSILWLQEGGYMFIRESCFHGCGTKSFRLKSKFSKSGHAATDYFVQLAW